MQLCIEYFTHKSFIKINLVIILKVSFGYESLKLDRFKMNAIQYSFLVANSYNF